MGRKRSVTQELVDSHMLSDGATNGGGLDEKPVNPALSEAEVLKASQTGDVKILKQLLDAGGGDSVSTADSGLQGESFTFLERNIQDLDSMDRESFHSIASVEQEIATANLDDIEVDSRDSWESHGSRDSIEMFNERREVKWTRFIQRSISDEADSLRPTGVPQDSKEDEEIMKYCELLKVNVRQSWPLFISGAHLKLKSKSEPGKFMIVAKLLGSKSKVLLDEDVTFPVVPEQNSVKFTDPLLLEVPSSSTILLLQVKHIVNKNTLISRDNVRMKTAGYVYVKVKEILQEESHRLHDFFAVQKGIPATLFCNCTLMSPYMNYITLLQLGSQNEKHEFGDESNHFRKIQNEDGEEVFTFARMRYSKKDGILKRSGVSERNINDLKACLEAFKFPWFDVEKVVDIILIKMNNKKKEIKEIVSIILKYEDENGKICFQIVYRKFDISDMDQEGGAGGKPKMSWQKFGRIELQKPGKLRNTLKKCRLESTTEFQFINESDLGIELEMKNPDHWKTSNFHKIPHIVGSWIIYENNAQNDAISHLDDRHEKLRKTSERKNAIIARAEVYIHYIKEKKAFFCGTAESAKYIYRGFKLMVQKNYVKSVAAISAMVIAIKECELQECRQ